MMVRQVPHPSASRRRKLGVFSRDEAPEQKLHIVMRTGKIHNKLQRSISWKFFHGNSTEMTPFYDQFYLYGIGYSSARE
jgi:hypothetical protein